jgi:hypothetical protein
MYSQDCILWQFRKLPIEVRRVLWWYFDTISPRYVNLASHLDIRPPKRTIELLQICQETRQLAQELYRRPLLSSPVLIRLDQAILNLRTSTSDSALYNLRNDLLYRHVQLRG